MCVLCYAKPSTFQNGNKKELHIVGIHGLLSCASIRTLHTNGIPIIGIKYPIIEESPAFSTGSLPLL